MPARKNELGRIAISVLLIILALITIGDTFFLAFCGVFILPALLIQIIFERHARTRGGATAKSIVCSMMPAFVTSALIIIYLSRWAQPSQIFELTLGENMPESVSEFVYQQEAFTDYIVRFHCRISPDELDRILTQGDFVKESQIPGIPALDVDVRIEGCNIDPIVSPTRYSYGAKRRRAGTMGFTLFTNQEHNRIYVVYFTD